jgi:hypothetical protein
MKTTSRRPSPPPRPDANTMHVYRMLTGPDDSSFCHRVTEALNKGWTLYGSPTLTHDPESKRVICGQAITKEVDGVTYSRELKLSEQ